MPTMFVVRRTSGCSSISTSPITYGSAVPSHDWWFTVNECTVPRPLTSAGAASRPSHCGQIGAGG